MAKRRRPRRRKKKSAPTPQKEVPLVASTEDLSPREGTVLSDDASQPDYRGLNEGTSIGVPADEDEETVEFQSTPAGLIQALLTGTLKISWTQTPKVLLFIFTIGYFFTIVWSYLQANGRGELDTPEKYYWFLTRSAHVTLFVLVPVLILAAILFFRARQKKM